MKVQDHLTLETLQRLEKKESDASQAKRLRIIILAIQGFTAPAIALTLGMSRRAVQKRVERFNREGLQGLNEGARRLSARNVDQGTKNGILRTTRSGSETRGRRFARSVASMCNIFWRKSLISCADSSSVYALSHG